ncbi:hypothetical protein GCM10022225_18760 [Plantactinospora mayteni]|uniref:Uncharacterized protein n=1 Tax=Plantactinospora mayteni TaxID=566021 RepID=A0ABQ4EN46_9ACTN|nr:hypothetical protein [Plantactinospora mayteni]GIG96061.1 hypothetical protein Pma05_26340 [Plantactinospora mayteni]
MTSGRPTAITLATEVLDGGPLTGPVVDVGQQTRLLLEVDY